MIAVTAPGHPVKAGAGYDCQCGECDARRVTLLAALEDAAAWLEERGGQVCADCDVHPAGLCEEHATDLDKAEAYRTLARELEAGR